ncbi:hypothetical protein NECAME_00574 [Necator americanus]|uniref:Uncharacterized protein n=1 Tax=Necator americanus TaxID=51031 RepID=W2SZT2_NECAM|nr:hypothetical protein NECAME_00574 [Necator americanus]ETN75163.1 hypothetical protein NECAME_00574 [Necator americanus]
MFEVNEVQGKFNTLHAFLQAYSAPFHLGLGYFILSSTALPKQKPFVFAQAFCAFMSLFTRLLAAWHLTEKSTRGLLISDHGKGSFYLENAFYIDAALCLLTAFVHFAFPQHILKLVITSQYTLDSHHIMWCRMYGCLTLLPALCSLSVRYLRPQVQIYYLGNRLVAQVMVFVLNVFGHWALSIYSPNHISGFMISGFFMSFLFSSFYRANSYYKELPESLRLKPKSS